MIGEIIESAIWITGDESPEVRSRYESDVTEAIDYFCSQKNLTHGPVGFVEKHPMDAGVPEVPNHIHGSKVRLLVASSEIIGRVSVQGSFVANLELSDLKRLRGIIRKTAKRPVSNKECDYIIEEIGPEAAIETMRRQ